MTLNLGMVQMEIKCERVEQITLFLENRPGILADLCAHISDYGLNLRAISTHESTEAGSVRLIVSDPDKAKRVLAEADVPFSCRQCLAMEIPNHPGGFAAIARKLAVAGVNIEYIYASATPTAPTALAVLGVSDLDKAESLAWG
jgi:hypothetical protein